MPEITRFYGVIIKMYFQQADHNPPHIHAFYNGSFMGAIDIKTLKMLEGDLPPRALRMVQEWTRLHAGRASQNLGYAGIRQPAPAGLIPCV